MLFHWTAGMHLGSFRSAAPSTTTPEMEITTSQAMDENGMKMDLGLAKIIHPFWANYSDQTAGWSPQNVV